MSENLKIEKVLQALALIAAETFNVSSAEAVGIVANSQVGIGLKDHAISASLPVEELADRLLSEMKMAV